MIQVHITDAQREILRLVASFRRLYGPLAIEAAMKALSQNPQQQWHPVIPHLEALREKGLVHLDDTSGAPRFYITDAGVRAAKD
jgi:hypothetical protein